MYNKQVLLIDFRFISDVTVFRAIEYFVRVSNSFVVVADMLACYQMLI